MSAGLIAWASRWLQDRLDRRGFLARAALAGSAVTVAKMTYLLKPISAYDAICVCKGRDCPCDSKCCEGWTALCCSLPGGAKRCPAGSIAAGWWKAAGSRYCDGPRYYIDCNARCQCECSSGICAHCDGQSCHCPSCSNWGVGCNRFRYGQCHPDVACVGRIVCRVVSCTPPWRLDPTCTRTSATENRTADHYDACLG